MRHHRQMAPAALALPLALGALNAQAADIVQTLQDSERFSTLADAVEQAGLAEQLKDEGPYTVFAPTNEAFDKLPQGVQQHLMQKGQSDQLKQVLGHHVVEGKELTAKQVLGKETEVSTLSGDQLTIDGKGAVVVLVPTGLSIARVGDEVFVRREVGAVARPAVTVSTTEGQQGQTGTQAQGGQQRQQTQAGQQQQGQQQQSQQQAQTGQQGQQQAGGQDRPVAEQQGVLRAAMVVEPDIQADNGVIHAIDQVLVPQTIEQQLAQMQGTQQGQQEIQQRGQKTE